MSAELKERKRVAVLRRQHEAMMRRLKCSVACGHDDCEVFNAAATAVAAALDWALTNKMPTEWLTSVVGKALAQTIDHNALSPEDLLGDGKRAPDEVN